LSSFRPITLLKRNYTNIIGQKGPPLRIIPAVNDTADSITALSFEPNKDVARFKLRELIPIARQNKWHLETRFRSSKTNESLLSWSEATLPICITEYTPASSGISEENAENGSARATSQMSHSQKISLRL
jgi:hypothetical protein